MSKHTPSSIRDIRSRSVQRAQAIWAELDYAQRRVFELQTGVSLSRQAEIAQLEQLYHLRSV